MDGVTGIGCKADDKTSSCYPNRDRRGAPEKEAPRTLRVRPDMRFAQAIMHNGGDAMKRCYQCATCSVVCSLSPTNKPFPRKEMLWAQWGLKEELVSDLGLWLCHGCGDCSTHCPRGAKPSEALAAMRASVIAELSFPHAIAKAVQNPVRCLLLMMVPSSVLAAAMLWEGTLRVHPGPVVWSKFMPHSALFEGLFFGLMGWGVLVGAVGVVRLWRRMALVHPVVERSLVVPVWKALLCVLVDLALHRRFGSCEQNRHRKYAHALTVFGFLAAMLTAGGGAVLENGFGITSPLPNPDAPPWAYGVGVALKVIGVLGAVGLVGGAGWMVSRRLFRRDEDGTSSFFDGVFLAVLLATGVSGSLVYVMRLLECGAVGYPLFFVHLSLVAFLLSTMAYTKFAHVFYRTAAMTFALHVGRGPRAVRNGSTFSSLLVQCAPHVAEDT